MSNEKRTKETPQDVAGDQIRNSRSFRLSALVKNNPSLRDKILDLYFLEPNSKERLKCKAAVESALGEVRVSSDDIPGHISAIEQGRIPKFGLSDYVAYSAGLREAIASFRKELAKPQTDLTGVNTRLHQAFTRLRVSSEQIEEFTSTIRTQAQMDAGLYGKNQSGARSLRQPPIAPFTVRVQAQRDEKSKEYGTLFNP